VPVFGTAGHVDHGKSTLIEALTGRDPDRWDEEKQRGLTIDLGFAWMRTESGTEVAFVDVPGHERFIKNMLAGIEAIDAAMFVVAADEGWMPQSEEHLAVLELLEIQRGVVVLTKSDLVDADLLELAQLEVAERLANTVLADAPMVDVSARTGSGIDELSAVLDEMAAAVESGRPRSQRPRLWVDRSFSIAGAGTVVTGTLIDGSLSTGDELELLPAGVRARVRGLHQHEEEADTVRAGSRCAINLAGLERTQVGRGMMLGLPGDWRTSDRWLVRLRSARYEDGDPSERGAYHVHFGTGAWPAELRPIPNESGYAVVRLPEPVPVAVGDRFVLREVGRRAVVAGGQVIDPSPARRRTTISASLDALRGIESATPDEQAEMLLGARGVVPLGDLSAWTGGGAPLTSIGGTAISPDFRSTLAERAATALSQFHEMHPLRPGMPRAQLARELDIDRAVLDVLIVDWPVIENGATVASRGFAAAPAADTAAAWARVESNLQETGLTVPRIRDLGLDPEVLHVFLREGRLIRINDDFAFLPTQIETITAAVRSFEAPFSVAEFRDALQLSRKYAVPLLEYLDASGVTARSGDLRSVRHEKDPEA